MRRGAFQREFNIDDGARPQHVAFVAEFRASRDAAVARIDVVIKEHQATGGQHLAALPIPCQHSAAATGLHGARLLHIGRRHQETHVDGRNLVDRHQRRGIALAHGGTATETKFTGASGNGRGDSQERQLHLR